MPLGAARFGLGGITDLGKGARYRVLCLIRFILNESLKSGNMEYLYDLEKQVYSLYEIEEIFGINTKS